MSTTLPFYIVDVFAENKYEGNQLAVFEHDDSLSAETMQAIAKEIGFAETTFINTHNGAWHASSSESSGRGTHNFDVRIFTTECEIPFAGHPTLGTAFVIQQQILQKPVSQVVLNLKVGNIPVDFEGGTLWMQQINPIFGKEYPADELAEVLGIEANEIDTNFPKLAVSTGLEFIIIPVKNLKIIQKIKPNVNKFINFLLKHELYKTNSPSKKSMNLFIFTNETYSPENQLNGRMFMVEDGVLKEDSATGSANGCLLGYLLKTDFLGAILRYELSGNFRIIS